MKLIGVKKFFKQLFCFHWAHMSPEFVMYIDGHCEQHLICDKCGKRIK